MSLLNINPPIMTSKQRRQIFSPPLSSQRYDYVQKFLMAHPEITSITDLGCGNGRMMLWVKRVPTIKTYSMIDISTIIEDEVDYYVRPSLMEMIMGRSGIRTPLDVKVYRGDFNIPNEKLVSDCFTFIEVIEHMLPSDVETSMRVIFGYYMPLHVIVSTPNREFNVLLDRDAGEETKFRHFDHKFEWTREEFVEWASVVCRQYPYEVSFDGVGILPGSEPYGPCTQFAIFKRTVQQVDRSVNQMAAIDLLVDNFHCQEPYEDLSNIRRLREVANFTVPASKEPEDDGYLEPFFW